MSTKKPTYEELEHQIKLLEQNVIALKKREDKYIRLQMELDDLFNRAPVAMLIVDPDRRLCKVNDIAMKITRLSKKESIGLRGGEALGCINAFEDPRGCGYSPACKSCVVRRTIMDTFRTGKDHISVEAPIPYPSENIPVEKWVLVSTSLLEFPEGNRVFVCLEDITERKRTEDSLLESEKRYRDMFNNNHAVMLVINPENHDIVDANPAAASFYGYTITELIKMKISDINTLPLDDISKSLELTRQEEQKYFLFKHRLANGVVKEVEVHTGPIKTEEKTLLFSIIHDVTDHRRAEEEKARLETRLLHAQKMEAIGTLAGGVAHEFNNILGVILGNTEIAMDEIPEWSPARKYLDEIFRAVLKGKDVVNNILNASRKSLFERKPISISMVTREALKLIRSTTPAMIEIQQNIECKNEMILGDISEIKKVLIHLCKNAIQAIGDKTGVIEVSLKPVLLERNSSVHNHEDLTPGRYVKLTVKDSGPGIDSNILDRIFDPYFSTKSLAERTGMGLAITQGVVKKHEGAIKVESKLGKGTVFEAMFPVLEELDMEETENNELMQSQAVKKRILFIDDENTIVEIMEQMLKKLGYEVETRTDSLEALELFKSTPDRFNLVISDIDMPNMSGNILARELLNLNPDIPIILSTGYSDRIDEKRAKELGVSDFIMKPIMMNQLAKVISKVLDKKRS